MADVHSKATRSLNMSRIRATNTKPEMLVRKFLHSRGFRYSLHAKKIFGKPDLFFKKLDTAVFIHGCFWHGHKNCKYATIPKSNTEFWAKKISGNIKRDIIVRKKLRKDGINVIELWECKLKPLKRNRTLRNLTQILRNGH